VSGVAAGVANGEAEACAGVGVVLTEDCADGCGEADAVCWLLAFAFGGGGFTAGKNSSRESARLLKRLRQE